MAVPKHNEMYGAFIKALADGEVHGFKEDIKPFIIKEMNITQEDLEQLLPSGTRTLFNNRVGWTRTYLKKAGLIESPRTAYFVLTEEGKKALPIADSINNEYLEQFESFRKFMAREKKTSENPKLLPEADTTDYSPQEQIETSFEQFNNSLADDLMDEVMKLTPSEFEKLVVELLLKLGYGSGIEDAGIVTQKTNDEGIDGIIKEDQLGFSSIYIQAKQWATDRTVDRPEVQKFAGALQGKKASKGLFITTARFSSGAVDFANNLLGSNIVLIDGELLTKLMIKCNLGVSTEKVYELKRIDSDYFMSME